MPLLLDPDTITTGWGRPVALPGLTTFNLDNRDFIVTDLDGWESTGKPDAVFVRNGGGPGGLATGLWLSQENYLTVSGAIMVDYADQAALRRLLLASVPADTDTAITVYGWPGEEDLQAYVRLYDRPDFTRGPGVLEFVLPLVMLDPFKYGLDALSDTMGVWTGEDWFLPLTLAGGTWSALLTLDGSWGLELEQTAPTGPYPESVTITSPGDATSQRVTFTISGPLTAGDWWLYEELTGNRLWIEAGVVAGQTAVLDCAARTATVAGVDATHLVYGDWFTLQPGANTYQLVAGTASEAFAVVSALPAYQ